MPEVARVGRVVEVEDHQNRRRKRKKIKEEKVVRENMNQTYIHKSPISVQIIVKIEWT